MEVGGVPVTVGVALGVGVDVGSVPVMVAVGVLGMVGVGDTYTGPLESFSRAMLVYWLLE